MKKKKWLGALLSLIIPGLGCVYAQKPIRGLASLALLFFVVLLPRFAAFNFVIFGGCVIVILIVLFSIVIDGYRQVDSSREYYPKWYDKWYMYVVFFITYLGVISMVPKKLIDEVSPVNFATILTPGMMQTLIPRDHFAFARTKSDFERNDVIVFRQLNDSLNQIYVQRCIGMPGDCLAVRDGQVFINDRLADEPFKRQDYKVWLKKGSALTQLTKIGVKADDFLLIADNEYAFKLTDIQLEDLKGLGIADSTVLLYKEKYNAMIYPRNYHFDWGANYFGSLYLPKKGDKIQINEANIILYWELIRQEDARIQQDPAGLIRDNKYLKEYEFTNDYYFVMGDSRDDSMDSRYFGPIPGCQIIGKALYTYWGINSGRRGIALNKN